jgi:nucleotide-binding universal stress UspA family protein
MLANWKSIAVFIDDTPEGERIGDYAASLARRFDAHLIGIHIISGYPGEHPSDSFARGEVAVDDVITRKDAAEQEMSVALGRRFAAVSRKEEISAEFRVIWSWGDDAEAVINSLHSDVVILGHPRAPGLPKSWPADRLLLASGVPTIVIPDQWKSTTLGTRVLIGWNGSRAARRAIGDAIPLLTAAEAVTVLVIDAHKAPNRFGAEPGADISLYLTRHNVRVELEQVTSSGSSIAEAVLSKAAEQESDLIVIGAYSHARSAEMLFGGVTRDLLARAPVPLFLSH